MKYTMTEDELKSLVMAAQTPGVFLGGPLAGFDPARSASEKCWEVMGDRYGFDWRTVAPVAGEGNRVFTAEPRGR